MNNPQIRLLKRIANAGLFDYSSLNADEKEILFYLSKQKFIKTKANPNGGERPCYKITELGKDELHNIKISAFSRWLPIAISFVALIKSFLPELRWLLQSIM